MGVSDKNNNIEESRKRLQSLSPSKKFPEFLSSYLWWNNSKEKSTPHDQTLLKKKRTSTYNKETHTFYKDTRLSQKPVDPELQQQLSTTENLECTKINSTAWSIDSVTLQPECLNRLKSGGLLDDSLIEFFFRFLHHYGIPKDISDKIFFFNSYFYNKLLEGGDDPKARHDGVKRWTNKLIQGEGSNKGIWEFEVIVVPLIIRNAHWTLALITYPLFALQYSKENEETQNLDSLGNIFSKTKSFLSSRKKDESVDCFHLKPALFHLDSLEETAGPPLKLENILISYLQYEFNTKAKNLYDAGYRIADAENWLYHSNVPVPTQKNSYDCGLFLIEYVRHLFSNYSKVKNILYKSPLERTEKWISETWFSQSTVTLRRKCLRSMILYMQEFPNWASSTVHVNTLCNVFHAFDIKELQSITQIINNQRILNKNNKIHEESSPSTKNSDKNNLISFSDEDEPVPELLVSWGGSRKV